MLKSIPRRITAKKQTQSCVVPVNHGTYRLAGVTSGGLGKRKRIRIKTKQYNMGENRLYGKQRKEDPCSFPEGGTLIDAFEGLGLIEEYKRCRVQERKSNNDIDNEWVKIMVNVRDVFLRRFACHSDLEESTACLDCAREMNPENPQSCVQLHLISSSKQVRTWTTSRTRA